MISVSLDAVQSTVVRLFPLHRTLPVETDRRVYTRVDMDRRCFLFADVLEIKFSFWGFSYPAVSILHMQAEGMVSII